MPLIEIRALRKRFGAHEVLKGIDLNVEAGQVVCIIGKSGSGKSTLLRCVNGLERHDEGQILLNGQALDVADAPLRAWRQRVGMIFQSFNLFPHLSVGRNVMLAPTLVKGSSGAQVEERARALLARVGLADKFDAAPDRLSGGQQQRVAIARALAMSPEVLLCDEITSALDPELVGEVLDAVRELKGSGITMLIATHEMAFAREISDRVCFLHAGTVAEMGAPSQIFSAPRDERTKQFLRRVMA